MKTFYRTLAGGSVMLLAFLLCSLFTACEEEEENTQIIVEQTNYLIDAEVLEKTIEFEVKGDWNASIEYLNGEKTDEEKEWLQLKKSHGDAGKTELKLELKPNHTIMPRLADIRIRCNGEEVVLHIEQANVAGGGGDEKTKRVKALYGDTDSGNGDRDMWNRVEFKYDDKGKLVRLYVGAGKINGNGTLEGDRHAYFYDYEHTEGAIITNEAFESISYTGSYADIDLEHLESNGYIEEKQYIIAVDEDGDVDNMGGSPYRYDSHKQLIATGQPDNADLTLNWDNDNMTSYTTPYGSSSFSYSSYLNNYNIDLNRYIPYGLYVVFGYEVPSDCLGERCKNLLDMSNAQFDADGYLVSFTNNDGLTNVYIEYEEVE